jgi:thiosulfate/3-mercaptopyruvate sulfurtransferase
MRPMISEVPPGVFVSTDWLARHLDDANVRVVDVRGLVKPPGSPPPRYVPKREDYDAGHIPGAVFVDWTRDIVDLDDPVSNQVARPEKAIGDGTLVVAYDDYSHVFAGRLRWVLRVYGHENVRVLEGGFATWKKEGRATTTAAPVTRQATFTPRFQPALHRTADQVQAAIERGAWLIDARPAPQFEGAASAARRRGHIPTARNVPYPTLLEGPDGKMRDEAALRTTFLKAGLDLAAPPKEIVVYCNGGVTATVPMMALERLGLGPIALYDGSWNEWGNDDTRPLEGPDGSP